MEVSHVSLPSGLHSWGVISVPALSVHFLRPDLKSPWLETFHYNFVLKMNITTPPPQVCTPAKGSRVGQRASGAFLPSALRPAFLSTVLCSRVPLQCAKKGQGAHRNLDPFNQEGLLIFGQLVHRGLPSPGATYTSQRGQSKLHRFPGFSGIMSGISPLTIS